MYAHLFFFLLTGIRSGIQWKKKTLKSQKKHKQAHGIIKLSGKEKLYYCFKNTQLT